MSTPPLSPAARRALLAGCINALGMGFTLPFLLVYLHTVRGIPLAVTGLVIATLGAAGLTLSPLAGTCIDRFGARRVQLVSLAGCTVGAVLVSQAHSTAEAFAAVALLGAAQAASWPSTNALLAGLTAPAQRSRLYALEFMLINAGIGVGGAAGGLLADVDRPGTFEALYLIDAATFVATLVLIAGLRGEGGPIPVPARTAESGPGGWREVLADATMRRVCLLFAIVVTAGYAQVDSGFPAYATTVAHVSTRVLGVAFAVNTALIVAGQLLILRHLEGRRRTRAIAGFGLALAASWSLLAVAGAVSEPAAAALIVGSMGAFAIGETLWSPTGNALVADLAPPHLRGRYTAMGNLTWQAAIMAGPIFASVLLDAGLVWPYLAALLAASGAVVGIALSLERRLTPAQNGVFTTASTHESAVLEQAPAPVR